MDEVQFIGADAMEAAAEETVMAIITLTVRAPTHEYIQALLDQLAELNRHDDETVQPVTVEIVAPGYVQAFYGYEQNIWENS